MATKYSVVTGADSAALNTAILAITQSVNTRNYRIVGFACTSTGSAFYALIEYEDMTGEKREP